MGEGTIELGEIESVDDLPAGFGLEVGPGTAHLIERADGRLFDYTTLAGSWKRWTYPPRTTTAEWVVDDEGRVRRQAAAPAVQQKQAFVGVRPCDLAAMRTHRRAVGEDGDGSARLIVAVECAVAGTTCFCTSMGTGPELGEGFDIGLTELDDGFIVRPGSDAGRTVVDDLNLEPAGAAQLEQAAASVSRVRQQMGTPLPMAGVPERLIAQPDHPRWREVAERCLACANCTLVCPTCFCTSNLQQSSLDGGSPTTERVWDSCFSAEFAKVAGGNFRTRSRGSLPAVADAQVRHLVDPVRYKRLCRLR